MRYIDNGNGKIPLISLIAILSISLTVNLPGLAITPVMGKLKEVFPHVSQLEVQMLTSLPNLIIIPVILLAGRLSRRYSNVLLLVIGLCVFLAAGIAFFFVDSMMALIILSCIVGVGCGFVIPLAASMISINFDHRQRANTLGMKSGTSNGIVIIATIFVGIVATTNWHMAFIVYLVPIVPLLLVPFMTPKFIRSHHIDIPQLDPPDSASVRKLEHQDKVIEAEVAETPPSHIKPALVTDDNVATLSRRRREGMLFGLIGLYIVMTYAATGLSYCLPFTMAHYKLGTGAVGVATAMFYASATIFGFLLSLFKRWFKALTIQIAIIISLIGLAMVAFLHTLPFYIIGVFLTGVGYGIVQPMIYNKTTALTPDKELSTLYFSYVLTGNYIAIAGVPFFIKLMANICGTTTEASPNFAFTLNTIVVGILLIVALIWRRGYVFSTNPRYYRKK